MDKPADPKSTKPSAAGGPNRGDRPLPPLRPLRPGRYDDEEEKGSSKAQAAVGWIMLVATLALAGSLYVMIQRSTAQDKAKKAEAAKLAAEQARADSVLKHAQDSIAAWRSDSLAKIAPKVKPPAPGQASTAGGAEEPPPPPEHFGIDVGTFLSEDRANAEVAKLQGSTGLPVQVQPVTQDGVTSFRVVLGDFTSRGTADEKATELIVARSVREAKVIKLKR